MKEIKLFKFYFFVFSLVFVITIYSLRIIPTIKRLSESLNTGIINIELTNKLFLQLFLGVIGVLSLILLPLRRKISKVFTSFSLILNILLTLQFVGNEIISYVNSLRENIFSLEETINFMIMGAVIYISLLLVNGVILYKNINSNASKELYFKY